MSSCRPVPMSVGPTGESGSLRLAFMRILPWSMPGVLLLRAPYEDGDVVGPAFVEGVLQQVLADLSGGGHGTEPVADPVVGHMTGETVAAKQADVAPLLLQAG